jgi:3-hydroxymyristoyl/3-hydroxydecanoyl-(acyl carrier protein) dehydratase
MTEKLSVNKIYFLVYIEIKFKSQVTPNLSKAKVTSQVKVRSKVQVSFHVKVSSQVKVISHVKFTSQTSSHPRQAHTPGG